MRFLRNQAISGRGSKNRMQIVTKQRYKLMRHFMERLIWFFTDDIET